MASKKTAGDDGHIAENRRARYDYEIGDVYEAGLMLTGSEVKSLRTGKATIAESYVNERVGMSAEEAVALSPSALLPLRNVPIAVRVGAREPSEFHRNAALLIERWMPSLTSVNLGVVADRDHFDVLEELDHQGGALLADVRQLLGLDDSPASPLGGAAEEGVAKGGDVRG